jgi:polyisoprenoid-binding protein YceI
MIGCVGLFLCATAVGPAFPATQYVIQPERSEFVVRVYKAGVAARLAHDHVVRAIRYSGSVTADPTHPITAAIAVTVQTDSLRADEPEIRHKYGISKDLRAPDQQAVQSTMLGKSQLDAARYPTITFHSTAVTQEGPEQFRVMGDLALHGKVRQVTFPVSAHLSGDTLRASGSVEFVQSDFGIRPYTAFFGAVRNQDRVTLLFDIVAGRRS